MTISEVIGNSYVNQQNKNKTGSSAERRIVKIAGETGAEATENMGKAGKRGNTESTFAIPETKSAIEMLKNKTAEMREKIQNGEIQDSYQIGGKSYTVKEWEQFLKKVDGSINKIKEQVEKESEELKEQAQTNSQPGVSIQSESENQPASEFFSETENEESISDINLAELLLKDRDGTNATRGSSIRRHMNGEDNAPYFYKSKDGIIDYKGVTFVCDTEKNRLCLGDVSNPDNCLNIPLSGGGSLIVNTDDLGKLSKAIDMFSPEDAKRIMRAIAQYYKTQKMKKEIDDDVNSIGDAADHTIKEGNDMDIHPEL